VPLGFQTGFIFEVTDAEMRGIRAARRLPAAGRKDLSSRQHPRAGLGNGL